MELSVNSGRKTIFNHSFISLSSRLHISCLGASLLVIKSDRSTISNHQSRLTCQTLKSVSLSVAVSCHSRAIIMTLLHTIHLHGRVPEALCSSSQTTISLSLLPYFSTRPEFTRICYHITKIYASSSPPPVSRLHQEVILFYSHIHLLPSYSVTSCWGLIAKDFSNDIYHA